MSCFAGQLPGIGTVFIVASLQMCKVQRQSPLASQGGWGGRRLEAAGSGGSCARRSLSGIPSSTRALHNAGQCTRSSAFDQSKLMIHTGIPIASVLSNIKLAVTSRRPGCCSSGCLASKKCSCRPNKKAANVLSK